MGTLRLPGPSLLDLALGVLVRGSSRVFSLGFCVALWTTLVAPAGAESITQLPGGRVSVIAKGAPLGHLLRELAALTPLDIVITDPALANRSIHLVLEEVHLSDAAARILTGAGLDFAVGGLAGQPLRVIVGGIDLSVARPALPISNPDGAQPVSAPSPISRANVMPSEAAPADPDRQNPDASAPPTAALAGPSSNSANDSEAGADPLGSMEPVYVPATGSTPGFTIQGENVAFDDPSFVPYKNTEAARKARLSVDVSRIP